MTTISLFWDSEAEVHHIQRQCQKLVRSELKCIGNLIYEAFDKDHTIGSTSANYEVVRNGRRILNEEAAVQIFSMRHDSIMFSNLRCAPTQAVALHFGVSPKTIRDIWNGRTWSHITTRLDICPNQNPGDPLAYCALRRRPAHKSVRPKILLRMSWTVLRFLRSWPCCT